MGLYENAIIPTYKEIRSFYPVWYWDVLEMDALWRAQGAELDGVRETIERIVFDGYINTADAATISLYEKFLGITPEADATLDERRSRVAAMMYLSSHIGAPEIREIFGFFAKGTVEVTLRGGEIELVIYLNENGVLSVPAFLSALKRLTPAHLSLSLVFETKLGLRIGTYARGYEYRSPMTGKLRAGTWPQRNTRAGITDSDLAVQAAANNFPYSVPGAGTKPQRNTPGGVERKTVRVDTAARSYGYDSAAAGTHEAGTIPGRSTAGANTPKEIQIDAAARGFSYVAPMTGKLEAGEVPQRSTIAEIPEGGVQVGAGAKGYGYAVQAAGRKESGTTPRRRTGGGYSESEIQVEGGAEGYPYGTPYAGTKPQTDMPAQIQSDTVQVEAGAEGYPYAVPAAGTTETGTTPERDAKAAAESGAFFAVAEGEGFQYTVKPCGTSYCKS